MLTFTLHAQVPNGTPPLRPPNNLINFCSTPEFFSEQSFQMPSNFQPICTDPNEIKYIKVAVHFLLPTENVTFYSADCTTPPAPFTYYGPGNFTETSDGNGNPNYNGYIRAEELINKANYYLAHNSPQWRKANDPNQGELYLYYETKEYGNLQLNLVHIFTGHTVTILPMQAVEAGNHQLTYNMSSMTDGNYALQAIFKQLPYTKQVIKE